MERTTIIFVRHAQSLHPFKDDRTRPLTEDGLRDRAVVQKTLEGRHIDAFISSPYKRSVDTILPLAQERGMEITTDERLRERKVGIGSSAMTEKRWADHSIAEPEGECIADVQERNIEALKEILRDFEGNTVVIGTHGTALSSILNYYDRSFGAEDFFRIGNWMPYILEVIFEDGKPVIKSELAYIPKDYQKIDFSVITACGESCRGCAKKADGICPGCIEADGVVPEWKDSGRCRIHACTREHGVSFCGLCELFPCDKIPELISWDKTAVQHLTYLRDEYRKYGNMV